MSIVAFFMVLLLLVDENFCLQDQLLNSLQSVLLVLELIVVTGICCACQKPALYSWLYEVNYYQDYNYCDPNVYFEWFIFHGFGG